MVSDTTRSLSQNISLWKTLSPGCSRECWVHSSVVTPRCLLQRAAPAASGDNLVKVNLCFPGKRLQPGKVTALSARCCPAESTHRLTARTYAQPPVRPTAHATFNRKLLSATGFNTLHGDVIVSQLGSRYYPSTITCGDAIDSRRG